MITTIEDAQAEVQAAIADAVADDPDESVNPDDIHHDMVASIAWLCDDDTARELCRRELGNIPFDLEGRLGRADWVR